MGQPIQIHTTTVVDAIAMFATDRGVTGQQGVSVARGDEPGAGFPAALAQRIFVADAAADRVFVASNQVVVRRPDGWVDGRLEQVAAAITGFFVHYEVTSDG
ncbi:MAG: hypothetical protein KJ956_13365 [Actinobacteria bacterium]|nr:hypothetical protein [Actinomycetota bacterium]